MACILPVVTTDIGGKQEVLCQSEQVIMVPFGDSEKLLNAVDRTLKENRDKHYILECARENSRNTPIDILVEEFEEISTEKMSFLAFFCPSKTLLMSFR